MTQNFDNFPPPKVIILKLFCLLFKASLSQYLFLVLTLKVEQFPFMQPVSPLNEIITKPPSLLINHQNMWLESAFRD